MPGALAAFSGFSESSEGSTARPRARDTGGRKSQYALRIPPSVRVPGLEALRLRVTGQSPEGPWEEGQRQDGQNGQLASTATPGLARWGEEGELGVSPMYQPPSQGPEVPKHHLFF